MATLQPQQLDEYFDRVQWPSEVRGDDALAAADLPLLRHLISQHQRSVPFENLSLVRGSGHT
jgi:arylamine N-acetyltransferase